MKISTFPPLIDKLTVQCNLINTVSISIRKEMEIGIHGLGKIEPVTGIDPLLQRFKIDGSVGLRYIYTPSTGDLAQNLIGHHNRLCCIQISVVGRDLHIVGVVYIVITRFIVCNYQLEGSPTRRKLEIIDTISIIIRRNSHIAAGPHLKGIALFNPLVQRINIDHQSCRHCVYGHKARGQHTQDHDQRQSKRQNSIRERITFHHFFPSPFPYSFAYISYPVYYKSSIYSR